MQILARQNYISIEWPVAFTTGAGLMYVNAMLVRSREAQEDTAADTEALASH